MVRICIVLSACLALAVSCVSSAGSGNRYDTVYYRPEFASGFDIAGWKDSCSRVIRVYAGWQEADSSAMELFLARGGERPPEGFSGQVIEDHASRLAVMSSSYVGFLACLGACDSVAAVSGKHFISDVTIRSRSDEIVETGSDSAPDYEGLLAAEADLALIYGVASRSPMEAKLEELGIPYMYMGEYLEPDPLGRAEWMVVLSEILGDREKGEAVFREIAGRYDSLKTLAASFPSDHRPAVMLNAPYGDVWYMSSAESAIVKMIEDAGGEYIYKDNYTNKPLPVSREEAFQLASEADIWLDTGSIGSLDELGRACPGFSSVKCFRNGMVFNNDARMSPGGGNEFWETSSARPDLVLNDLIGIFHPETAEDGSGLYYYRRLE